MKQFSRRPSQTISISIRKDFLLFLLFSILFHTLWLSIPKITQLSKVEEEKEVVKLKIVQTKKRQIVQTNQKETKKKEIPKEVFLGKNTSIVDKQMVAKKVDKFNNEAGTDQQGQKKDSSKTISLSDLGVQKMAVKKPIIAKNSNAASARRSATTDHVEDVPLGELTQLNTTEFKFYGFYHRIRQKLEQYWGNSLREKAMLLHRQGKAHRLRRERVTALVVVIDHLGNIVRVRLKSTSGVKELDDAAVESFNKAGPFPNPPHEMLKQGHAEIEWGFVVKA